MYDGVMKNTAVNIKRTTPGGIGRDPRNTYPDRVVYSIDRDYTPQFLGRWVELMAELMAQSLLNGYGAKGTGVTTITAA